MSQLLVLTRILISITIYTMKTARLFKTGRSLAVRLPKDWIGEATEVEMERRGVDIILRPKQGDPWTVAEECGRYGKAVPKRLTPTKTGVRIRF
jgi:virulence-associated protein VagC